MLRRTLALAVLSAQAVVGSAAAQPKLPILAPERPGEANSPWIVAPGTFYIEGGVKFTSEASTAPDTDELVFPDMEVRIGVLEWLELQVGGDGLVQQFRRGADDRALHSDMTAGLKLRYWKGSGWLPSLGAKVGIRIPTGSDAVTSDGVDPFYDALFEWDLDETTALVLNLDFGAPSQGVEEDRRVFELEPQLALARQFTPRFGAFVEYFGKLFTGGVRNQHSLDGGFTFLVHRHAQLDLAGGGGLVDAAPDWFVSAGLTVRFRTPWAD